MLGGGLNHRWPQKKRSRGSAARVLTMSKVKEFERTVPIVLVKELNKKDHDIEKVPTVHRSLDVDGDQ